MPSVIVPLVLLVVLSALAYWLLVVTEGTYLGAGTVALLYDWTAKRYDSIKDLEFVDEARLIGLPLAARLESYPDPLVLDVAAGTGRVAAALIHGAGFEGHIHGVDRSLGMLKEARRMVASDEEMAQRVLYSQQDARALAFPAEIFAGVVCLEALEFMPRPDSALREMLRVLRPEGVILLSNRVGKDAWFFPGRLCGRGNLERHLKALGFADIVTQRWQVHYDLVWARKPARELPQYGISHPKKASAI